MNETVVVVCHGGLKKIFIKFLKGIQSDESLSLKFKNTSVSLIHFNSKNVVEDKKSGEYRLSHHVDLKTGYYKGRQVFEPKE